MITLPILPVMKVGRADLGDQRHLSGRAGDEAFIEAVKLLRPDTALHHLEASSPAQIDHRLAG